MNGGKTLWIIISTPTKLLMNSVKKVINWIPLANEYKRIYNKA